MLLKGFVGLLALLFLSGCQSSTEQASMPIPVEAITLKTQAWRASLEATATVFAVQGAILKSETSGRVTTVAFKPGDRVSKGAVLFEINPAQLLAKLKMSRAVAVLEQANYQRALRLYAEHVISKADFDRAQSAATNNGANVEVAEAELDKAVVHAPFAGQVGLNLVQEGDYVAVGQALVSLQQLDQLRLDFSVPEQFSAEIKVGDAVSVASRSLSKQVYRGQVSSKDNAIDTSTRLLSVRATIPNVDQRLLPGAFVDVKVFYGPALNVLAVPQMAVVNAADGDSLYRIVKGKVMTVSVKLGNRFADQVIIEQGIKAGDVIMTSGQLKVKDGSRVSIIPSASKR